MPGVIKGQADEAIEKFLDTFRVGISITTLQFKWLQVRLNYDVPDSF